MQRQGHANAALDSQIQVSTSMRLTIRIITTQLTLVPRFQHIRFVHQERRRARHPGADALLPEPDQQIHSRNRPVVKSAADIKITPGQQDRSS